MDVLDLVVALEVPGIIIQEQDTAIIVVKAILVLDLGILAPVSVVQDMAATLARVMAMARDLVLGLAVPMDSIRLQQVF